MVWYFPCTYIGDLVGGVRRCPLFDVDIWMVGRMENVGVKRTNNAAAAFRHALPLGSEKADLLGVWTFVETHRGQQNIPDNDIADLDIGVGKTPRRIGGRLRAIGEYWRSRPGIEEVVRN